MTIEILSAAPLRDRTLGGFDYEMGPEFYNLDSIVGESRDLLGESPVFIACLVGAGETMWTNMEHELLQLEASATKSPGRLR